MGKTRHETWNLGRHSNRNLRNDQIKHKTRTMTNNESAFTNNLCDHLEINDHKYRNKNAALK